MKLKDKVSVVTGAGSGLGKAIALRFAQEGSRIVVAEINEATAQETLKLVHAQGRGGVLSLHGCRGFRFGREPL